MHYLLHFVLVVNWKWFPFLQFYYFSLIFCHKYELMQAKKKDQAMLACTQAKNTICLHMMISVPWYSTSVEFTWEKHHSWCMGSEPLKLMSYGEIDFLTFGMKSPPRTTDGKVTANSSLTQNNLRLWSDTNISMRSIANPGTTNKNITNTVLAANSPSWEKWVLIFAFW